MTAKKVVGIDPGFASVGLAVVRLEPGENVLERLDLIRTAPSGKKRKVLASDDNLRRARELAVALKKILAAEDVVAICAESMSFPRNSGAASKMAMCWGIVAAQAEECDLPVVQATPKELKKAICGTGTASKAEVEAEVRVIFGTEVIDEMLEYAKATSKTNREHPIDALAAILACIDSEVVRMARRMAT